MNRTFCFSLLPRGHEEGKREDEDARHDAHDIARLPGSQRLLEVAAEDRSVRLVLGPLVAVRHTFVVVGDISHIFCALR